MVQTPFGNRRWEDWVSQQVMIRYCEDVHDSKNAEFHRKRSAELRDEWTRMAKLGKQKVYFRDDFAVTIDMLGYEKQLEKITGTVFPCGPEKVSTLSTLYRTSGWGKAGAEIGLGIGRNITTQYRKLVDDLEKFEGIDGFSKKPDHPLSKMRQVADSLFAKNQNTSLSEIWDELQSSPFGLMPSHIGVTLFGFFLKGYAQGYYWSDGVNSFSLNPDKLAELIDAVLKQKKGYDAYEIRKMAPEHEQLCSYLRHWFELPHDKTSYPEEAKKALRSYFTRIGYPVWSLYCLPANIEPTYTILKPALEKLEQWLSASDEEISAANQNFIKELVSEIGDANSSLRRADLSTDISLKKTHFETGMRHFTEGKEPGLIANLECIGLDLQHLMSQLKELMNEEVWLWKTHQVEARLPIIHADLAFLDALNQLCAAKRGEPREALQFFRTKWISGKTKLPPCVHAEFSDEEISSILSKLCELADSGVRDTQQFLQLANKIKENKEKIRQAISNPEFALSCWVQKHIQADVTEGEAREILSNLPDLSRSNTAQELERQIRTQINAISRRKLAQEVRVRWKTITGSHSPDAWSEDHKTPITWALENSSLSPLYETVNNPGAKTESELLKSLRLMEEFSSELSTLNDERQVNDCFLGSAAADYRPLIRDRSDIESFKKFLHEKLKSPVMNWPMKLTQVRQVTREWVSIFYKERAYQRVVVAIESMPENQAKSFLKDLASDPLVGSLLIKKDMRNSN